MNTNNIVLVTGMSGAGKTSAMAVLEDMGYHCIDNFPVDLIDGLGKLLQDSDDNRYHSFAFATSLIDYPAFLNYFKSNGMDSITILLDASKESLLLRYQFTRRHHPMMNYYQVETLAQAIDMERELLSQVEQHHAIHIDTSKLSLAELKDLLKDKLALSDRQVFSISFVSFGFKHGIPLDADLVLDVRFLPNPYYIDELKKLTGDDKAVYDYVMGFDVSKDYVKRVSQYLDLVFEQYQDQNKSHMMVAVGCTGGHHRSVSIANWLYSHYKDEYTCYKSHRDKKVG